ncbi:MAG: hypothetical protein AVO35_11315 [Candidatus Aegiribacteria sp. MLS_C]|nr:MAG: hypothetical protein AVO35_11315 [Candidatus Aegiribacteria sp. MLS_C]
MRFPVETLTLLMLTGAMEAQAPDTLWTETFGGSLEEHCYDCVLTSDGGFAMVGFTSSAGAGEDDVWLVRTDSSGNMLWQQTYGGTSDDRGYSLAQTSDGGFILGGWTFSFGAGMADIWLIKTDGNGNLEWDREFGTTSGFERCYPVIQTSDGSYVIAGETDNNGTTYSDIWLLKTDGDGDILWDSTFGGARDDFGLDVIEMDSGDYAVAGWTCYVNGTCDLKLFTTDQNGVLVDESLIGGAGTDQCRALTQLPDGDLMVVGETNSTASGLFDAWLVRADQECNLVWENTYGSDGQDDFGNDICILSDGNVAVCGLTKPSGGINEDLWLFLTDTAGSQQWHTTFGGSGSETGEAIVETDDGGVAVAGCTGSFGAGSTDFWLLRTEGFQSVGQQQASSGCLQVLSAAPNPFTCSCRVTVGCAEAVDAEVFSIDGRLVRELQSAPVAPGTWEIRWDGTALGGDPVPPGVYILRMVTDGGAASVKLYRMLM